MAALAPVSGPQTFTEHASTYLLQPPQFAYRRAPARWLLLNTLSFLWMCSSARFRHYYVTVCASNNTISRHVGGVLARTVEPA
jgi:hypothetical protein